MAAERMVKPDSRDADMARKEAANLYGIMKSRFGHLDHPAVLTFLEKVKSASNQLSYDMGEFISGEKERISGMMSTEAKKSAKKVADLILSLVKPDADATVKTEFRAGRGGGIPQIVVWLEGEGTETRRPVQAYISDVGDSTIVNTHPADGRGMTLRELEAIYRENLTEWPNYVDYKSFIPVDTKAMRDAVAEALPDDVEDLSSDPRTGAFTLRFMGGPPSDRSQKAYDSLVKKALRPYKGATFSVEYNDHGIWDVMVAPAPKK